MRLPPLHPKTINPADSRPYDLNREQPGQSDPTFGVASDGLHSRLWLASLFDEVVGHRAPQAAGRMADDCV